MSNHSEEVIPTEEKKWNDIFAYQYFKGKTFEAEVSKLVMTLVRRYDQNEKETDGVVHWKSIGPTLRQAFQKIGRTQFVGLCLVPAYLQRMQQNWVPISQKFLRLPILYFALFQGHTGGNVIALALMGHVAIPFKWKEFLFHRGCSFAVTSILRSGLTAGGKESKEGRQIVFSTPFNPFGDNPDEEEFSDDSSKRRKAHNHSRWKPRQDAVYRINLA